MLLTVQMTAMKNVMSHNAIIFSRQNFNIVFSTALKIQGVKHVFEATVSYVFVVSLEENSLTSAGNDENPSYGPFLFFH